MQPTPTPGVPRRDLHVQPPEQGHEPSTSNASDIGLWRAFHEIRKQCRTGIQLFWVRGVALNEVVTV